MSTWEEVLRKEGTKKIDFSDVLDKVFPTERSASTSLDQVVLGNLRYHDSEFKQDTLTVKLGQPLPSNIAEEGVFYLLSKQPYEIQGYKNNSGELTFSKQKLPGMEKVSIYANEEEAQAALRDKRLIGFNTFVLQMLDKFSDLAERFSSGYKGLIDIKYVEMLKRDAHPLAHMIYMDKIGEKIKQVREQAKAVSQPNTYHKQLISLTEPMLKYL